MDIKGKTQNIHENILKGLVSIKHELISYELGKDANLLNYLS